MSLFLFSIYFEKVFVANPNKPKPITDILLRNKEKLIEFLSNFHSDRNEDEQFNDEKAYLIKQIKELKEVAWETKFDFFSLFSPSSKRRKNTKREKKKHATILKLRIGKKNLYRIYRELKIYIYRFNLKTATVHIIYILLFFFVIFDVNFLFINIIQHEYEIQTKSIIYI